MKKISQKNCTPYLAFFWIYSKFRVYCDLRILSFKFKEEDGSEYIEVIWSGS
jgi:hypothetical protein